MDTEHNYCLWYGYYFVPVADHQSCLGVQLELGNLDDGAVGVGSFADFFARSVAEIIDEGPSVLDHHIAMVAPGAVGVGVASFLEDIALLARPVQGIVASEHGKALPLVCNHPPAALPEEHARPFAAAYAFCQAVVLPNVEVIGVGACN